MKEREMFTFFCTSCDRNTEVFTTKAKCSCSCGRRMILGLRNRYRQCRKNKGLSLGLVANKLGITDRTLV